MPEGIFKARGRTAAPDATHRARFSFALLTGVALLGALVAACDDSVERDEASGELSQAVFRYLCLDESDLLCEGGARPDDFPLDVAVGSRFQLQVSSDAAQVDSAASRFVSSSDGRRFSANAPGLVALTASTGDGVVDFIHLRVVPVADLELRGAVGSRRVGETLSLRVYPLADSGDRLAGSLAYRWTSSDPSVLEIASSSNDADALVLARAPGSATLRVEHGSAQAEAEVEVVEAPPGSVPDPCVKVGGTELCL